MRSLRGTYGGVSLAALTLFLAVSASPAAHDIPADVTVHAFVRPQGERIVLIVRAPLLAMRDVAFPTRGPGFIDLARADDALREAATIWIARSVALFENDALLDGRLVNVRASLPSDRSFGAYEQALTHVTSGRLHPDTDLIWDQALLDAVIEYPIESDRSEFSIRMGLERLGVRVSTVLRFVPPAGPERAFEFAGDAGLIRLDPRWHQAALRFVRLGFVHILEGIDHLLFLLCLVIPLRKVRPLVLVVTAFTVAHSVTLIGSAYGMAPDALWFPALVETLIAMSIVYMALENIVKVNAERRWLITFAFGLIHGFGFSFALRERMQFAGSHVLTSLLSFNVGVELGQLLVLAILVPILNVTFRYVVAERMGTIILCAVIAHTGWHWMLERGSGLSQYEWPAMDSVFVTEVLWWLLLALFAAWAASAVFGRRRSSVGAPRADAERAEGMEQRS